MNERKWLARFLYLETVAGVPGMVAGMPGTSAPCAPCSETTAGARGSRGGAVVAWLHPCGCALACGCVCGRRAATLCGLVLLVPPALSRHARSQHASLPPPLPSAAAHPAGSTRCWRRPRTSACTCSPSCSSGSRVSCSAPRCWQAGQGGWEPPDRLGCAALQAGGLYAPELARHTKPRDHAPAEAARSWARASPCITTPACPPPPPPLQPSSSMPT